MRDATWWARRYARGLEVPYSILKETYPYLHRMAKGLIYKTPFGERVRAYQGGFGGTGKRPAQSQIGFPQKKPRVDGRPSVPSRPASSNG